MIQQRILALLRQRIAEDGNPMGAMFGEMTDDQLIRQLFANYRSGGRGMRLTTIGLQFMKTYFRCFEIKLPEGHQIRPTQLLYLDRQATLPYHYSRAYLVVFDGDLGLKLKLADGDIQTLIDMDSDSGSRRSVKEFATIAP